MFLLKSKFYSPDELPSGMGETSSSGSVSKEDIIEILGEDVTDDEKLELDKGNKEIPETKDKGKKDDEDKEEKEDDEDEDELDEIEKELNEETTDEDLELVSPVSRKEILKAYPDLFKKFPYLEKAYYREREFTERFATIEDADNAVHSARVLNALENDVKQGNIEPILASIHKNDKEGFAQIVDNYLPTLAKVDPAAHLHVVGNIMKQAIYNMVAESNRTSNEALKSAAAIVQQFMFGTSQYTGPTNLAKPRTENKNENELNERQMQFEQQRYATLVNELDTKVNNVLKNTIEANIDPKESMTSFVKKHAVNEVMRQVGELIGSDKRLRSITDRLWQNAQQNNFSPESVGKIRSAYLAKAKSLLPTVIKKARNEALRGMGKNVKDDNGEKENKRGPINSGRPRPSSSGKVTKPSDIPRGVSTLEFLSQD
jgi:hypothetical protein